MTSQTGTFSLLVLVAALLAPPAAADDAKGEQAASDCKEQAAQVRLFIEEETGALVKGAGAVERIWRAWRTQFHDSDNGLPASCPADPALLKAREAAELKLAYKLVGVASDVKDPQLARWILSHVWVRHTDKRNSKLATKVKKVSKAYDKKLLSAFKEAGSYATYDDAPGGCVVSKRRFPKKPKAVRGGFSTYLAKAKKVYVLCRLPQAAASYAGRTSAKLHIRLVDDTGSARVVLLDEEIGDPASLKDRRYVQASFKLPPEAFEHKRWFFDVDVALSHAATKEPEVLGYATFFWSR